MLVRKHIHSLLSSYYNQPHHAVVGSIIHHHQRQNNDITQSPINFANILGEWHWRYIYQKLYKQQTGQWLTPVELFKPFYSQIIGNFISMEATKMKQKNRTILDKNDFGSVNNDLLQIVEIGGGRGTNALCILDHLKRKHPDVYRNVESYTIMDSSPTLLNHVKQLLVDGPSQIGNQEHNMASTNNRHNDKIIIKQVDMLDVAEKRLVKNYHNLISYAL